MKTVFEGKRIGFALTGSFCTLDTALEVIGDLVHGGAEVVPILSHSVDTMDTKFLLRMDFCIFPSLFRTRFFDS